MAIQVKRGTSAQWAVSTFVLAVGQPGAAIDPGVITHKIGNGVDLWPDLVMAGASGLTDGSVTNTEVAANAAISLSKTADSTTRKALTTSAQTLTGVKTFTSPPVVPDDSFTIAGVDTLAAELALRQTVARWLGSAWETRPPGAPFGVVFLSTNDVAAPEPDDANLVNGDIWRRHPDGV